MIVVSKAARKHYGHHASPHLPTSDLTLIQAVNEDWERFEPSDDGYWRYELGEYNTLRQGGRWEPREWCIVLVFEELSGEWVVTHFGPSN